MNTQQTAPNLPQRGRFGRFLTTCLTLSDFVILNLIYLVVLLLHPHAWEGHVRLVGLLLNVAYLPAAIIMRPVRRLRIVHMDKIIVATLRGVAVSILLFFAMAFFLQLPWPGVMPYIEYFGALMVLIPIWCTITRILIRKIRRRGHNFLRVVIVGTHSSAIRLYEELKLDAGYGYNVLAFFDDEPSPTFPYKSRFAGPLSELRGYVTSHCIDQVYYTMSGEDDSAIRMAIRAAEDGKAQFFFVPRITRYLKRSLHFGRVGDVAYLSLSAAPLASSYAAAAKRAFDLLVSGTFLLFSPLIFVPVAIGIKLSSPGPVFFKQKRTGLKGREFECLKFRTMRVNANADKMQATRDDPRKTRFGDLLRRTSIDELPQFINVFKGDMSIVGPRPHMLLHTEEYSQLIEKYMVRHLVKPGITGWAQVNGYRGQTKHLWQMERRVEYDTWYIENWSFMLDVKIVVRTFINIFRHEEGAF